jgi:putative ATP-dependent endonuclease of OLD family
VWRRRPSRPDFGRGELPNHGASATTSLTGDSQHKSAEPYQPTGAHQPERLSDRVERATTRAAEFAQYAHVACAISQTTGKGYRARGRLVRIKSVEIENFRSIKNLACEFGAVTSLVGPNGAGKSNVLRAMDWFFNGDKNSLTIDDIHKGSATDSEPEPRVRVRVDFTGLTLEDRTALGPRYCPDAKSTTFTAWRTFHAGSEKITGRAFAYPAFEGVRSHQSATDKRAAYNELKEREPELELPACRSAAAVDEAMDAWEREHPEQLSEAEVSDTHFFGVAGQGKLSDLFDFVFVSADLRATEETSAARDSLLSRILQRAIEREGFDSAATLLVEDFAKRYAELGEHHLATQLDGLAAELTSEVAAYSPGRSIRLRNAQASVKPVAAAVEVLVAELATETPVALQGHGFQRTLLLAALSVLSRRRRAEPHSGQMFLAIEEPELFQHPTQAKAFASVLRSIATAQGQQTQVAYATHNPYFVNPSYFDEVRRISPARSTGSDFSFTRLTRATSDAVAEDLSDYVPTRSLIRRWEQVCLKYLSDAFFAESVILVEGDEDAAILEGMGRRINDLAVTGVCVAPVEGKGNMLIPFAILRRLEVPVLMVVDNDSGCAERMRRDRKHADEISRAMDKHAADNRKLCRFVGGVEEDFPIGAVTGSLAFVPDTLETLLASDLPGWDLTRKRVIEEGRGVDGKNAATYELAARECDEEPGDSLRTILQLCTPRVA